MGTGCEWLTSRAPAGSVGASGLALRRTTRSATILPQPAARLQTIRPEDPGAAIGPRKEPCPMRPLMALVLTVVFLTKPIQAADAPMPKVAAGWSAELVAQAPAIAYPTAVVVARDGT